MRDRRCVTRRWTRHDLRCMPRGPYHGESGQWNVAPQRARFHAGHHQRLDPRRGGRIGYGGTETRLRKHRVWSLEFGVSSFGFVFNSKLETPNSKLPTDKTHRARGGNKITIVDAVTRFFFQRDVLD